LNSFTGLLGLEEYTLQVWYRSIEVFLVLLGGLLLAKAFGAASLFSSSGSFFVGKKNFRSLDRVFNLLFKIGSTGMS
jgi:hypothetical protein